MTIRNYEDADLTEVLALWRQCFPEVPSAADFRMLIDRKRATQPNPFVVAIDHAKVVGTAVGGMDGINGWLYLVAVHPDVRRNGVGRRLVRAVESRLLELGVVKLGLQLLVDREDLVAFYNSLGYAVEPRVSMARLVDPAEPGSAKDGGV